MYRVCEELKNAAGVNSRNSMSVDYRVCHIITVILLQKICGCFTSVSTIFEVWLEWTGIFISPVKLDLDVISVSESVCYIHNLVVAMSRILSWSYLPLEFASNPSELYWANIYLSNQQDSSIVWAVTANACFIEWKLFENSNEKWKSTPTEHSMDL